MRWRQVIRLGCVLVIACRRDDPPPAVKAPAASASSAPPASAISSAMPTSAVGPRFVGYFDRTDPRGPHFSWPGTRIDFRFEGTAAKAKFLDGSGGHVHFTVVVDGTESRLTLRPGEQTYVLASGLAKGPHDVSLFRNSEALWGETQLLGIDVDGPYLKASAPTRRLLFIGDSITCGYGTEGKGPGCGFVASEENAYRAWAAVSARTLGADAVILAFSGGGVYRNNDGDRDETMGARIQRTVPTRKASPAPPPDDEAPSAIVINLATNDFALGAPPAEGFQSAYAALLDGLHRRYPAAPFVSALGPMLYGRALDTARALLKAVVTAGKSRGLDVELLELPMQDGSDGWGCQHHPSVKRQEAMARDLSAHLQQRLHW